MAKLNDTIINGSLSVNGTVTALSFNATSDRRAKEKIELYSPLHSITDLPVYSYTYKDTNYHTIGCIADELEKICPIITNVDQDGHQTIQETKLVYLLLLEVKALKHRIEQLESANG